jgi:hypothetical protein
MPTKLQLLRKERLRWSRNHPPKRGRRLSEQALRKESEKQFYGKLGPASPVKRIDPKTGEVVEIISTRDDAAFLKRPRIKKRGWFGVSQKEPNGGKPNRNHHCKEENDPAFGPVHSFED